MASTKTQIHTLKVSYKKEDKLDNQLEIKIDDNLIPSALRWKKKGEEGVESAWSHIQTLHDSGEGAPSIFLSVTIQSQVR